jgi:hypothetical protein
MGEVRQAPVRLDHSAAATGLRAATASPLPPVAMQRAFWRFAASQRPCEAVWWSPTSCCFRDLLQAETR